jgi:hypothetical protein
MGMYLDAYVGSSRLSERPGQCTVDMSADTGCWSSPLALRARQRARKSVAATQPCVA